MSSFTLRVASLVALLALSHLAAARSPPPPPPSYVIAVAAQPGGTQAYPRGCQNRAITIAVGQGSAAVTYSFTVDTGSGLFELSCQSPVSQRNCNNKALTNSYVFTNEKALTSAAACATTGVGTFGSGCLIPTSPTRYCYYSQGLTGGHGYNGKKGLFANDVITVKNVLSSKPLSFPATFACGLAKWSCGQNDSSCINSNQVCPTSQSQLPGLLDGPCIGDNAGIEAGFTFSLGGKPSAVALPEQVFQAGLIKKRVLGVCWQPPQKDASCSAAIKPNSAVVLGPALPSAIASTAQLYWAPLYNASFGNTSTTSAAASTHTFRSWVLGASVPTYGGGAPWTYNWTVGSQFQPSILWDTGAYGIATVPSNVFAAFKSYYTAARAQVVAKSGFTITACDAKYICGSNQPSGAGAEYACQKIALPASASPATRAAARAALASMYPSAISINLGGANVAKLPAAYVQEDCAAPGFNASTGVAVCSAIQAPTTPGSYFWVGGPWFTSRFVQFDLTSAPGVVRWSDPIGSCAFPSQ